MGKFYEGELEVIGGEEVGTLGSRWGKPASDK